MVKIRVYLKCAGRFFLFIGILVSACYGCDDSGDGPVPDPSVPGSYLVYIKNHSDKMWIGTFSDSIGNIMEELTGEDREYWIGGGVVPDNSREHDFYFDPYTVLIAEATVEGMQTTIEQISKDPEYYRSNGWGNGLTDHAWYVKARFIQYTYL